MPWLGVLPLLLISSAVATNSSGCTSYYASSTDPDLAPPKRWCQSGSYFTFHSRANNRSAQLFGRCSSGVGTNQTIMLGHGWPTSSYDFAPLASILESHSLRVCAIDYVGHGFSDKPRAPWRYHITDHAWAVHDFIVARQIKQFAYLTHDEGASVGLALLQQYQQTQQPLYTISHHFILDGSIYLPKASIQESQKALLSNLTGPALERLISAQMLAKGLGSKVFSPQLSSSEVSALASVLDYQSGTHILHDTIQYLQDRREHEVEWLEVLHNSSIDCTMIWGTKDPIATLNVSDYVWQNYLRDRPHANSSYFKIEGANHYLQIDHVEQVAAVVLKMLSR